MPRPSRHSILATGSGTQARRPWLRRPIVSLIFLVHVMTLGALLTPALVTAQTGANPTACNKEAAKFLQFPTWYKYLNPRIEDPDGSGPQPASCQIDFEIQQDIPKVLLAVFEIILRVASIVAIVFIIWGGFQYMVSQGEGDRVSGAKTTVLNAVIGLAIAISATAIVNLIGRTIS